MHRRTLVLSLFPAILLAQPSQEKIQHIEQVVTAEMSRATNLNLFPLKTSRSLS